MSRGRFLVVGLVAAVAGGAATTSSASVAASDAAVPRELVGAYRAFLPKGPGVQKPGRWELAIGRGGAAAIVTPGGSKLASGPVTVSGRTITFPGRRGYRGCTSAGTYSYSRRGDVVRFTKISDACAFRVFELTSRAWTEFEDYEPVVIVVGG